ncbi:MAG: hypothetical protein IH851_01470 [Armatimonadetes bacterium]|nr:hypothetical protein [Armatimonadota bacterium]
MRDKPASFWVVVVGIAAVFLLVGFNVVAVMIKPGDDEQLRRAMEEMRQASLDGKPGGVLQRLSESFELRTAPDEIAQNPRSMIARFIRDADISELTFSDITTEVEGDTAIVRCNLKTDLTYQGYSWRMDSPIAVEFRREVERRLFVIPEGKWKVVEVSANLDDMQLRL